MLGMLLALYAGTLSEMIRVYRYGLLAPTMNGKLVKEQMRAAHRYRNALIEIECARRDALRRLLTESGLRELEEETAAANEAVHAAAAAAREARMTVQSKSEPIDARQRMRDAREVSRRALDALRVRRREVRENHAVQRAMDEINERAARLRRGARALCGVYWGTYLLVEDADHRARAAALYDGAQPNNPRCSRFVGAGRVGVQIQKGFPCETLFGSDARLRVAPVDSGAWHSMRRGERRQLSRTTLSLRIGSEGRDPIWAQWPMLMHRPLPEGSIVKRATVSVRRRGPRDEWAVEITVDVADEILAVQRTDSNESAVAIHIGWRAIGNELRVAAWAGSDGRSGELRLPASLLGAFAKVEELRSIRDRNLAAARDALSGWLAAAASIPEWLREATVGIMEWRVPSRLAVLAKQWRNVRFVGDEKAYEALEAWRYHDYHLWSWEDSQRIHALRARRELYRIFAAQLAREYVSIVIEDFDLRVVAKRHLVEDASIEWRGLRRNRQAAAVSELRASLQNASKSRSARIELLDTRSFLQPCHACGSKERFDSVEPLDHSCSGCGAIWDRDSNAALVLLQRWRREHACGGEVAHADVDTKPVPEGRWVRARRHRAEKDAHARFGASDNSEWFGNGNASVISIESPS